MMQKDRYNEVWQDCLEKLRLTITEEEFVKWFKPIKPIGYDGAHLRLRVPNESFVANIEKHYLHHLKPIISEFYGEDTLLYYSVPRKAQATQNDTTSSTMPQFVTPTDTTDIKNPFVIPGLRRIMFDPQLNSNYTFEEFEIDITLIEDKSSSEPMTTTQPQYIDPFEYFYDQFGF